MNREGLSPLHEAAIKGNVDVIAFFLNQGGNPNSKSKSGETALHFAVVSSNEEAVKILLAKGADPDIPAERGTPREISKKLRLPNIEKLLNAVPVKAKSLTSSGNIQSSGSGISGGSATSKAPAAFSPPPDLPPPPPPGTDDGNADRGSFALDESALNDLITKISDPPGPGERVSKPLPAPPGKKPPLPESPRTNGKEELNDLLDELDFGVRHSLLLCLLSSLPFLQSLTYRRKMMTQFCLRTSRRSTMRTTCLTSSSNWIP